MFATFSHFHPRLLFSRKAGARQSGTLSTVKVFIGQHHGVTYCNTLQLTRVNVLNELAQILRNQSIKSPQLLMQRPVLQIFLRL